MGLKGDFAKLDALRRRMKRIASDDGARLQVTKVAGAAALAELKRGFRDSRDPYGDGWAKLKSRKGKPLLDTARLGRSFSVRATPQGFSIGTNVVYAPFHQYGTAGRRKAASRSVAVGRRGRFLSKAKAGSTKRRRAVRFRRLNFKAGGGKIPPRMMLPSRARGLDNWNAAITEAANRVLSKLMRGK